MIHHVFANRSNVGDWLSARGIQALLGPCAIREHLCDEPFVAETLESLSKAAADDLIVIGGGGLFMDYFTPFWEGFRDIAASIPFCIWGVGYCDLKAEASRAPQALLEATVRQARLCVVRDELTRRHLGACKLPEPVPCPSIGAVDRPEQPGYGLLHVDNYSTAGAAAYEAMEACGREFAAATGRPYSKTNNRVPHGSEKGLKAVMELYAAADLVLTSALHGGIVALAMGRKVLAVSGDYKIESFMEAAGLGDWVCGTDAAASLPDRLAGLAGQPGVAAFMAGARQANIAVAAAVRAAAGGLGIRR